MHFCISAGPDINLALQPNSSEDTKQGVRSSIHVVNAETAWCTKQETKQEAQIETKWQT